MQWRPKAFIVMKRKACNTASTTQGLQNDAKNISSTSEAFQLLTVKRMVKETCTESSSLQYFK
jgi:hypothetical protein